MKTKDLIKQLQDMVDLYEVTGMQEIMGEHEIVIDCWQGTGNEWSYKGFSPNVEITYTSDGVYPVLAAKESWIETTVHS